MNRQPDIDKYTHIVIYIYLVYRESSFGLEKTTIKVKMSMPKTSAVYDDEEMTNIVSIVFILIST